MTSDYDPADGLMRLIDRLKVGIKRPRTGTSTQPDGCNLCGMRFQVLLDWGSGRTCVNCSVRLLDKLAGGDENVQIITWDNSSLTCFLCGNHTLSGKMVQLPDEPRFSSIRHPYQAHVSHLRAALALPGAEAMLALR